MVLNIVEILAFLVTLVLGGLWATHPSGPFEPWIVICGLVTAGAEIARRDKFSAIFSKLSTWRRVLVGIVASIFLVVVWFIISCLTESPVAVPDVASQQVRKRVHGILESAQAAFADSMRGLRLWQMHGDAGATSPIGPKLPKVLDTFLTDGEAFLILSKPMQQMLSQFSKSIQTFSEGYDLIASKDVENKTAQPGTISLMLLECMTQELCIRLEKDFQSGELDPETHAKRFSHALSYKAEFLICGLHHASMDGGILPQPIDLSAANAKTNAFWAGYHFQSCNAIVQKSIPTKEESALLRDVETRLHKLGLAVDLSGILSDALENKEKNPRMLQLLEDGLTAYTGEQTMAVFTFGLVLTPTLDTFAAYFDDPGFRKRFSEKGGTMMQVGATINSNIGSVQFPPAIGKQWAPLYVGVLAGDPETPARARRLKGDILAYFNDLDHKQQSKTNR